MAAEVVAGEDGPFSTPHSYVLSAGESFEPTAIAATFDGSAAAGAFLACCSFYSQDGRLLGRVFPAEVAAGDTAVVTYSPFALSPVSSDGGGGGGGNDDLVTEGAGLVAQTCDIAFCTGNHVLPTGNVYWFPVGIRAGKTVTGVIVYHDAAGAPASTYYRAALYSPSGATQLAISGDQTALVVLTGYREMAFTAPIVATADGAYWIGVLFNGPGGPRYRMGGGATAATALDHAKRAGFDPMYGVKAGPNAALPAAFNKAADVSAAAGLVTHWMGVY